jgi:dipeptidyl aminopeptidase/acylaminoacyl peptidase
MTLTLASRHPELWSAAVDMFGPYDLLTFAARVPETWKPFIAALVGDPETEREFLIERSPRTYIDAISAPLLVIQGNNDPRVREVESRELVDHLRAGGKSVDYLMLPDEGHDVLKFDNRVRVYNAITDFFKVHLRGQAGRMQEAAPAGVADGGQSALSPEQQADAENDQQDRPDAPKTET